jgi:hypothetical protein
MAVSGGKPAAILASQENQDRGKESEPASTRGRHPPQRHTAAAHGAAEGCRKAVFALVRANTAGLACRRAWCGSSPAALGGVEPRGARPHALPGRQQLVLLVLIAAQHVCVALNITWVKPTRAAQQHPGPLSQPLPRLSAPRPAHRLQAAAADAGCGSGAPARTRATRHGEGQVRGAPSSASVFSPVPWLAPAASASASRPSSPRSSTSRRAPPSAAKAETTACTGHRVQARVRRHVRTCEGSTAQRGREGGHKRARCQPIRQEPSLVV